MREITAQDEQWMWEEVRREFPDDEMMQEIHFVRMKMQAEMEGMSAAEQVQYIHEGAQKVLEEMRQLEGARKEGL